MPYCPRCQQWDHCEQDHGESVMHCPACGNESLVDDCPGVTCQCAKKDAEIADLKALIAKRAKVRVSVHDVWLRERARREKAEAEIARLTALVAVGREMATQFENPYDSVSHWSWSIAMKTIIAKWRSLEGVER